MTLKWYHPYWLSILMAGMTYLKMGKRTSFLRFPLGNLFKHGLSPEALEHYTEKTTWTSHLTTDVPKRKASLKLSLLCLARSIRRPKKNNQVLLFLFLLILAVGGHAQTADSIHGVDSSMDSTNLADSLSNNSAVDTTSPFLTESELIDSLLGDTILENRVPIKPLLTSDTIAVFLLRRVEYLALTLSQINRQLQQTIDTVALSRSLNLLNRELRMVEKYYTDFKNQRPDLRSLNSMESILLEIEARLRYHEDDLLVYNERLTSFQGTVDQIERDSINRLLPKDPVFAEFLSPSTGRSYFAI